MRAGWRWCCGRNREMRVSSASRLFCNVFFKYSLLDLNSLGGTPTWGIGSFRRLRIPLARRLRILAVLWVVTFVLLGRKIPLGSTGPVVDIEISPVLSKKWDNRDRKA